MIRGRLLILFLGILLFPLLAISQQLYEPSLYGQAGAVGSGARAFGMGGAFIAVADDGTASSFNPAGLCVLEKPEGSVVFRANTNLKTDRSGYLFTDDLVAPGI